MSAWKYLNTKFKSDNSGLAGKEAGCRDIRKADVQRICTYFPKTPSRHSR